MCGITRSSVRTSYLSPEIFSNAASAIGRGSTSFAARIATQSLSQHLPRERAVIDDQRAQCRKMRPTCSETDHDWHRYYPT